MQFDTWFDEFFNQYYADNPVNASFIGRHEYDALLPDVTATRVDDRKTRIKQLLAQLAEVDASNLKAMQQLDLRAAEGYLITQLLEVESGHMLRKNPTYYTGEAIFGVLSPLLTDYAPLSERVRVAVERMRLIPEFLAQAKAMMEDIPSAWKVRALNECAGAEELFTNGLRQFADEAEIAPASFEAEAKAAAEAFASFVDWLKVLPVDSSDRRNYAAGAEGFNLLLKNAHFAPMTADDLLSYAYAELNKANEALQAGFAELGFDTPEAALSRLNTIVPSAANYYTAYQGIWDQCRDFAVRGRLVTWPDFPIEYVPRPQWVDAASRHLYFLFYRAPAAFNRPVLHQYLVNPLPRDDQDTFLRANNFSVIKLNHVVHHGSIGHHVQNWNAYHSDSCMGQVSAVDTASRVAMMTGLTMAEGWACYATDLMGELGFYTPLEAYSEHQSRRRMCARAIVDIELHRGNFSFDEAVRFYQQCAAMPEAAARSEVTKNSMYPAGAVIYLLGQDGIHTLCKEIQALDGGSFNRQSFHDEFLSYGSLPVYLIAEDMKRRHNAQ